MNLYYRSYGNGYPVIILHGLYGTSDNWQTIGKKLSENHKVIIPDLRNHGQSPHSIEMNFDIMVKDILSLLHHLKIKECIVLGHSMGGKLAMKVALDFPEIVRKLIVIDVAPKSYLKGYSKHFEFHKNVVNIMSNLDLINIKTRKDAENSLIQKITSVKTVRFLLKNLKRKNEGYQWRLNIEAIHRNLHYLIDGVNMDEINSNNTFINPVLFIKGGKSDYILDKDYPMIEKMFPDVNIVTIEHAGHWVHAEQTGQFLNLVSTFISQK